MSSMKIFTSKPQSRGKQREEEENDNRKDPSRDIHTTKKQTPCDNQCSADSNSSVPLLIRPCHPQSTTAMSSATTPAADRARMVGAGIASGLLTGLLIRKRPLIALLVAMGVAYAAEQQPPHSTGTRTLAGDTARAIGDVALLCRQKFCELDQQHGVVLRSHALALHLVSRMREYDQQHQLRARTQRAFAQSLHQILEYVQEHQIVEKSVETMGKVTLWVMEKIAEQIVLSQRRLLQPPPLESFSSQPQEG